MSFERFENPTISFPEKSKEVSREQILKGSCFEFIKEKGWTGFREELKGINYSDIVENQIKDIEQLKQRPKEVFPEWMVENSNRDAEVRAKRLQDWFIKNYPKEGGSTFYGESEDQLAKKVIVDGKKQPKIIDGALTRIYISSPSKNSPEIFKDIVDRLVDNEVMSKVSIALNLESYQGESVKNKFEDNNIIIYVRNSSGEILTKVVRAIAEAKESNHDKWRLSPEDIAEIKRVATTEFLIPIDDQVHFVEMEAKKAGRSYHSDVYASMFEEIHGSVPGLFDRDHQGKIDLEKIHKSLSKWSSQRPLNNFPQRRSSMPGLVFEK